MALKTGDIYVSVAVGLGEFDRAMKQVASDVAKVAKKLEGIGNKLGSIGAMLSAGIAASLATAAKSNAEMASQLERVKDLFFTLGVEVGEMFAPALRSMAETLGRVVSWFQSLNPELKKSVGEWGAKAAAVLVAAGALGKLSGAVGAVAEGFALLADKKMLSGLVAAAPMILAVAAAAAGLALAAGAVYNAWTDGSSGFKEAVSGMLDTVKGWGRSVADFFGGLFSGVGTFIKNVAGLVLDNVAWQVRTMAKMLAPVTDLLGLDTSKLQTLTGENIGSAIGAGFDVAVEGLKAGVSAVADGAKAVGEGIAYGLTSSAKGAMKLFGKLLPDGLGGTGASPKIRRKLEKATPMDIFEGGSAPGKTDEGMDFEKILALGAGKFSHLPAYFDGVRKAAKEAAEKMAQEIENARAFLTSRLKGAFGALADLADVARAGFTAGGASGAIEAVAVDLLTHSATFQRLISMASNFLQTVSDTLGQILLPVLPVLASVFDVVGAVLSALAPVVAALLAPLAALAPIFQVVAMLLRGLAPIIQIAAQFLAGPILLAFKALEPALKTLFPVITTIAAGLLWVVSSLAKVWNGIVGAIQSVFNSLSGIPLIGKYMKKISGALGGLTIPTAELDAAQRSLKDATWQSTTAAAAESVARWENVESLKSFNEELSNVPSGFKVDLARFNSMDAASVNAGLSPSAPGAGSAPAPVDNSVTNIVINAPNANSQEVAEEVTRLQDARSVRLEGRRTRAELRSGRDNF